MCSESFTTTSTNTSSMSEYRTDVDRSHHTSDLHFRLQDDNAALADPASENDVLQLLNSTDGELSGLSHLDAPISDSVYMICGVLIAMVLVGLIIVLLAITISKLRKREENNNVSSPSRGPSLGHNRLVQQQQQLQQQQPVAVPVAVVDAKSHPNGLSLVTIGSSEGGDSSAPSSPATPATPPDNQEVDNVEVFLWSACPSQQLVLYGGTQDSLGRALPCEEPQDTKGLRKNLRGKWRRLVKKKPEDSGCGIPPELREQLKQIYVY